MPRLGPIGEAGFKKSLHLSSGLTHSLFDAICGRMLSVRVLCCRIVDAIVNRVLPREVAQVVKVPTTLDSTEWGRVM